MKDQIESVKTTLMGQIQSQMGHLDKVNAKELGEVVDMVKDLAEMEYYCSIVEAMEDKKESKETMYYREYPIYRDKDIGRYVPERMYYTDGRMTREMRDMREGRSPEARRHYMESKELHHDKTKQLYELENYLKELSTDLTELIEDASPEERAMLRDKMTSIASKIK